MALEGTLRDFSFADILQLISLQRKTGVLTLKHEDKLVTISFLDGCIVGSSSLNQHTEDRIGLILLKRGEITEAELEAALKRQEETLQRLGRILIDHHVVTPETVREALEQQILQIVFRVFRWSDGEYHFSQETDIDYDRDLMRPMAADSIIMEGARMTDEWPFIDQRIPDREVVFIKSDHSVKFEVVEEADEDFEDLGFNFTESPEEPATESLPDDRITTQQMTVYELVTGNNTVREIILESPLIEFETCKALADLVDRGIIREATQEEVVRHVAREVEPVKAPRRGLALPWLAIPAAALLFLVVLSILPGNPSNPGLRLRRLVWDRYVLETVSWQRMGQLSRAAEAYFFLHGLYPESVTDLITGARSVAVTDPWGRPYRLNTSDDRLSVAGTDAAGEPASSLTLTRNLAWEGDVTRLELRDRPGVRLLD
jgi:hypothetical protein